VCNYMDLCCSTVGVIFIYEKDLCVIISLVQPNNQSLISVRYLHTMVAGSHPTSTTKWCGGLIHQLRPQ
jgi:hypothetical protein